MRKAFKNRLKHAKEGGDLILTWLCLTADLDVDYEAHTIKMPDSPSRAFASLSSPSPRQAVSTRQQILGISFPAQEKTSMFLFVSTSSLIARKWN